MNKFKVWINSIGEGRTDHFMSLLSALSSRGHVRIGTGPTW